MNIKAFLVLIVFVLLIAMLGGGMMSNTDLTPDTPPAVDASAQLNAVPAPLFAQNAASGSTRGCAGLYTIQSGDTLSTIANRCGLTLAEVLSVNPQITNANLIHIGQSLNLPALSASVEQAVPLAVVLPEPTIQPAFKSPVKDAVAAPTLAVEVAAPATPTDVASAAPAESDAAEIPTEPQKQVVQGQSFKVRFEGLPPNTDAYVGIGKLGFSSQAVASVVTDATGSIELDVQLPPEAQPGETWVTMALTQTQPPVDKVGDPFLVVAP